MVYENVGDLWQHLLSGIDLSELTEKIISVVITVIVFFILIKVSNGLVNKFFNENKKNITPQERKRVLTLKKALKTFLRTALLLTELLTVLSFFTDVGEMCIRDRLDPSKTIFIANKTDSMIENRDAPEGWLPLSLKEDEGVEALKDKMLEMVMGGSVDVYKRQLSPRFLQLNHPQVNLRFVCEY